MCLVEDSKLQISDAGLEKQNVYGSKEDNTAAIRCLSEIKIGGELTKASLVSVIVRNLENVLEVNPRCLLWKGLIVLDVSVSDGFLVSCSARRLP